MKLFKTYIGEKENMRLFLSKYEEQLTYEAPTSKPKGRVPKNERFCRFCQKKSPDVTFKNEPHIIPELLGKNFGVSDFECDLCNEYYGKFETDFAYYLGLLRSFYFVKGKGNVPTFKSPNESLIARMETLQSGTKGMGITDFTSEGFDINIETGRTTITYIKHSYTPIKVFKCLLKIALSILPFSDFRFYGEILHFMSNDENHEYYVQFAKVWSYETNVRRIKPACYIFRRRNNVDDVPKHVFMLYFENMIYEFFIPRYALDEALYITREFSSYYCPPILLDEPGEINTYGSSIIDFTTTELLQKEKGSIAYQLDPGHFSTAQMIDPLTKEKSPFIPSAIRKITLFQIDENFDKEAFENGEGF
ncbi:HNH endonuclease [Pedobacter hiemivivus]|uniref:HNH endonuclease 5 domain-containing protein n=1 Tax=Pedobacter hiemivivus TaxID=2530454 RepID=A0A4R0N4Z1_9SPHI|nr:HNH endonuclease [Pedobacter hiemivivus]TCC95019.1 hypothetical protein EZ444_16055 [Pedobacter hiemivivus]